jgi:hypothetical protein
MLLSKQWPVSKAWRLRAVLFAFHFRQALYHRLAFFAKPLVIFVCGLAVTGCVEPRDTERVRHYDKPLISPGTEFASLPPAVQNTIRAETGSADIADVTKDYVAGRLVYRVRFEHEDLFPQLNIAPDGSLLNSNLTVAIGAAQDKANIIAGGPVTSITLSDLPPAVVKAIQRQAPDAQVDTITKEVQRDQTTYLVTFKDRMHAAMRLASDGTVQ